MDFIETFTESLATLTLNKLRTGLAILGIVIGIGSVIALVSLGQATQQSIQNQIQSLGSNLLTVMPGSQSSGAVRGAAGGATTLTNADAEAISTSSQITTVSKVSPEVSSRVQVTAGRNNSNIQVIGATAAYADVHKVTIETGAFITDQDNTGMSKVVVLGPDVAAELFGEGVDPIGQTIRINSISLRVVGVTTAKGGTGFQNPDNMAYVPLQTAQKSLFGQTHLNNIALEAR